MKKGIPNEVNKRDVLIIFCTFAVWVQRCPGVVPGTLPGSLQGQNASKMGLQTIGKSLKMLSAGFLTTLL